MEPAIVGESDDYVFLNKPRGLLVHGDGRSKDETLADWLAVRFPETVSVGEDFKTNEGLVIKRPGIVHRLDKDTSGLIVVARNRKAFRNLKRQFKGREVKKLYKAIVYGKPKSPRGLIEKDIGRHKTDFRKFATSPNVRGKVRDALTHYKVVGGGKGYSVLELRPKTGRTHQIRVHLKSINHPVLCDPLYDPSSVCPLSLEGMALHSLRISFLGTRQEEIFVEAPMPEDLAKAIGEVLAFTD